MGMDYLNDLIRERGGLRVHLLGGSVDAEKGGESYGPKSPVEEFLKRNGLEFTLGVVHRVNSDELLDADRQTLVADIEESEQALHVVFHGTNTISETQNFLQDHCESAYQKKSIVLVCADTPLSFFDADGLPGDAALRIGIGLGTAVLEENGVILIY